MSVAVCQVLRGPRAGSGEGFSEGHCSEWNQVKVPENHSPGSRHNRQKADETDSAYGVNMRVCRVENVCMREETSELGTCQLTFGPSWGPCAAGTDGAPEVLALAGM